MPKSVLRICFLEPLFVWRESEEVRILDTTLRRGFSPSYSFKQMAPLYLIYALEFHVKVYGQGLVAGNF